MNKLSFSVFLLLLISFPGVTQILDDSTKLVYGPSTLSFYNLDDQKDNIFTPGGLDTTLYDLGNFTKLDQFHKKYQDLGANGTAMRPLFFSSPETIGLRSGYDAYNPFVKTKSDFRFFDTKSPFMDLYAAFGGVGRSVVDFDFSRNIKPNINFGFGIERITTDKQIGPATSNGDRNAVATNLDLNGFYRSKDNKYLAMFYAYRFLNTVNETGGVFLEDSTDIAGVFQYEDAPIRLRNVIGEDVRTNVHLYHEYKLGKALQLYHEFDHNRQKVTYFDESDGASTTTGFDQYADNYDAFFLDPLATDEAQTFRSLSNEVGVKGDIEKGFYRAYLKRRDVLSVFRYQSDERAGEVYVGGALRYDLNEKNKILGNAEFLQTGDFNILGNIVNNFFEASYNVKQYQPSLLQRRYFGNHFFWENDFQSVFTNEIKGALKLELNNILIKPKLSLTTISNFVYFNNSAIPEQANENIVLTGYGAEMKLKKFTNKNIGEFFGFDSDFTYTVIGGGDGNAFRAPELFYFGKLCCYR
ncbi:MAG: putative porin, partial [Bacteroidota bacterium]